MRKRLRSATIRPYRSLNTARNPVQPWYIIPFLLPYAVIGCLLWWPHSFLMAEQRPDTLPEPLTLDYALSLAKVPHPLLQQGRADIVLAIAEEEATRSQNRPRLFLDSRVRWALPSGEGGVRDDHALVLRLQKPLYDFGVHRAAVAAAKAHSHSQQSLFQAILQQHRLTILDHYFEVLLADLRYIRDNEAMAVAFVRADRFRQRAKLGQKSEVVLLEAEYQYQKLRLQRERSQADQRLTRSRLAASVHRPEQLPSVLETPLLSAPRPIPELDQLQQRAQAENPTLKSLHSELQAAIERESVARRTLGPIILGELEAGAFTRSTSNRDQWRAGVRMEIPLYTGGEAKALLAQSQAKTQRLQAELALQKIKIRQTVLEHWLTLKRLRIKQETLAVLEEFRDLDLDRNRILYELEAQADLGDAMARMSALRLQQAEADYQRVLTWARLDALQGKQVRWK